MIAEDNTPPTNTELSELTNRKIYGISVWIKIFAILLTLINILDLIDAIFSVQIIRIVLTSISISMNFVLLLSGLSYARYYKFKNIIDLEAAIKRQKLYWQLLTCVMISLLVIFFIYVLQNENKF
jgi:hypothetical protein